jgi:processive rubber oxygenase RoxA-like protein
MRRTALLAAVASIAAVTMLLISRPAASQNALDGKSIFRFDTFGDEQLWTKTLHLERAIATVSPATALGVGLKVDVDALPASVVNALKSHQVNLNDPAVTLQLLSANAVIGVMGKVSNGHLDSIGVTCALCHSTVDNSLTQGIGHRQDGWPNRDLNVGAIVALSTALTPDQRAAVTSWGKGKFDPRLQAFNGTTFISLNRSTLPLVIPPAYGLQRVGFETVTADGPISYWNNYVGVSQMGGHGNFSDTRIHLTITQTPPDLVTPKLPALRDYQLSLPAPPPPSGSFDRAAAGRGTGVFNGIARCNSCHQLPAYTDVVRTPNDSTPLLHAPSETGMEPVYASRSATGKYRTAPLRGVWQHPPYFHDGSAPDLMAVVNHYDTVRSLGLSESQKRDLVEFLKSL